MDSILKGNFVIPDLEKKSKSPQNNAEDSLQQQFESAALKKLGGSITFVKKPRGSDGSASFIWRGEENE